MLKAVRQLFLSGALLLFSFSSALADENLQPFVLAYQTSGDVASVAEVIMNKVIAAGFEIVGSYTPYKGAAVIAFTNAGLKECAASSEFGGYAAALRVSITKIGDEIQVAYTNPVYFANAYRLEDASCAEYALQSLERALGKERAYGTGDKGLSAKDLRNYRYMLGMEYFDDTIELAEYDSQDEAVKMVEKGLAENRGGAKKVYRIDIPGKDETVFGVALTDSGFSGDEYLMSHIDKGDIRSTAYLPYEMLVSDGNVYALYPRFRIAISYPHLPMIQSETGATFFSIMSVPNAIEEALTKVAGSEDASENQYRYPQTIIDAFWNAWVEELGESTRQPMKVLEKGGDYRLLIDLAASRYEELLVDPTAVETAHVNDELREAIKAEIAKGRTQLRLNLHVMAIGTNLRIDREPPRIVDVDLTKLKAFPAVPSTAAVPSDLTPTLSALNIVTEVHALAAGCGAIVIFVTASDGVRPLDHLVQHMEIVDGGGPSGKCWSDASFESGLTRLLALSGGPMADLGLQVIETNLGGQPHAAALLLDQSGQHWAWEMESTLSGYLANKTLLEASINRIRKTLTSDKPLDYSAAGLQLSNVIFSGKRPDETTKAKAALAALKTRVDAGPTPTVLIRAVDEKKNELFVPLRLITAKGQHEQFTGTLHVVHPLPHGENYDIRPPCVDTWTVAIPPKLGGNELPDSLRQDSLWLHPLDGTLESLRKYFLGAPPPKPEGLVLLSHHRSGQLWYKDGDEPILTSQINHVFPAGSVAVLLSCDTAAARESEMVLTRRLSTYGVDSLILSPFSLRATYGRAFSIGFTEAVQEARAAGRPDTLLQLFDAASTKAATRLKAAVRPRDYRGMELELIVAGDHSQTLCVENKP